MYNSTTIRVFMKDFEKVRSILFKYMKRWMVTDKYRGLVELYRKRGFYIAIDGGGWYLADGTFTRGQEIRNKEITKLAMEIDSHFGDLAIVSMDLGYTLLSPVNFARCTCRDILLANQQSSSGHLDLSYAFVPDLSVDGELTVQDQGESLVGAWPELEPLKGTIEKVYINHKTRGCSDRFSLFGYNGAPSIVTNQVRYENREVVANELAKRVVKKFGDVQIANFYLPNPVDWSYSEYYAITRPHFSGSGQKLWVYPKLKAKGSMNYYNEYQKKRS